MLKEFKECKNIKEKSFKKKLWKKWKELTS